MTHLKLPNELASDLSLGSGYAQERGRGLCGWDSEERSFMERRGLSYLRTGKMLNPYCSAKRQVRIQVNNSSALLTI